VVVAADVVGPPEARADDWGFKLSLDSHGRRARRPPRTTGGGPRAEPDLGRAGGQPNAYRTPYGPRGMFQVTEPWSQAMSHAPHSTQSSYRKTRRPSIRS